MKHVNALNAMARFDAARKQVGLSVEMLLFLNAQWQRAARRAQRLHLYWHRMAAYPYSSKRQLGVGGFNHPMAAQITPRRKGDFTGRKWGRA